MASWDDLAGLALARQFPSTPATSVVDLLAAIGPIQSQTARSPFLALAARSPGVTHAELTEAYESFAVVRGSSLRGTVHTSTAEQHPALHAGTRVGQRRLWARMLTLDDDGLDALWSGIEGFAREEWRTSEELTAFVAGQVGFEPPNRYLAFGHGGLVRRPVRGSWSGQSAAAYRTASSLLGPVEASLDDWCASTCGATGLPPATTSLGGRGSACGSSTRSSTGSSSPRSKGLTVGRTSTCPTGHRRARWKACGCCRSSTR